MNKKIHLILAIFITLYGCKQQEPMDTEETLPQKLLKKTLYDTISDDSNDTVPFSSIFDGNGDFENDGTQDIGNGINIDFDRDNDGIQDWGDGSNLSSLEIPPFDSDGIKDGDVNDDGIVEWGDGSNLPSFNIPPFDSDGIKDGDVNDDGIIEWGDRSNIPPFDSDGLKDGDINDDGTKEWGDGSIIDGDNNGYIDPPPLNMTYRDPTKAWEVINLGGRGTLLPVDYGDPNKIKFNFTSMGGGAYDSLDNQLSYFSWYFSDTNSFDNNSILSSAHAYATWSPDNAVDWKFYAGYAEEALHHTGVIPSPPNNNIILDTANRYLCETPEVNGFVFDFLLNKRAAVKVVYYHSPLDPNGTNDDYTEYMYKGINNGNGPIEVVGLRVTKDGVVVETKGDMSHNTPYVPTGYGPAAIG